MAVALEELQLLRSREVCALLAVSPRTLDEFVATKVLTPVRLRPGATRRFRATDVAALVTKTEEVER